MDKENLKQINISLLLLLAVTLLYWPAFNVFFSLDDVRFLLRVSGIEESPDTLKRIISTRLFFLSAWHLFGIDTRLYHLLILLLHTINGWLIYKISRRLGLAAQAAIYGSLIFILTPVAFLPMHWISGIQEISMAFFALLAVYLYLCRGMITIVGAFAAAIASVLCKEASLFLLPGLAICIPASGRRRWILGSGGLIIALVFLIISGALTTRPSGDPYEAVYGINIFWNALTYSAWLARFWDYFPDRIPQYQTSLALWGLILPAALSITAWRFKRARQPILKALVIFMFLLGPVLPLIRHSYFYYLYLPLIPFWILTGTLLGRISNRKIAYTILAGFFIYSSITGTIHLSLANISSALISSGCKCACGILS